MHNDDSDVEGRLTRFVRDRLGAALYREQIPLRITAWEAPGEPVPFSEAVAADAATEFVPFTLDSEWGKPWGTTWFHLTGQVPAAWRTPEATADEHTSTELVIDLGFNWHRAGYQAEGLLHTVEGVPVKAINPLNHHYGIDHLTDGRLDLYLEAASNPDFDVEEFLFQPTAMGDKETAGDAPLYRFRSAFIGLLDREVWELQADIRVLSGLLGELPKTSSRRATILRALEDMLNAVDPLDLHHTASAGRERLAPVLAKRANESAHTIVAIGHAHIDSAWLWPIRETIRKCARTFSNVLDLMDRSPEFRFAASSAQQFEWMKQFHPHVYARIREKVATGQFIPVGGMWVESDTNLPGGEALVRQFLFGQRFFTEEFGRPCEEVWLPDSFGYSGSLPQIATSAGARWMLTQKMSWSRTNDLPHHTFTWEGIDGSQIFTHLPPVDTYVAELTAAELAHAEANFREKGRATMSLVPFGYGDGGGGPTREMVQTANRLRSLEGSPTVEIASPAEFFRRAEAEYPNPPIWVGEMYLESHRGTYTSQAPTKRGNRGSEHLLREAELWATTATVRTGVAYPAEELAELWKTVLLLQFHDILPGSSIAWVHRDAERSYASIAERLTAIIDRSLRTLVGDGDVPMLANAGPLALGGQTAAAVGPTRDAVAGPTAVGAAVPDVSVLIEGPLTILDNGLVRVAVDEQGLIRSLRTTNAGRGAETRTARLGRESIADGAAGNLLQLHVDTPNEWDAWDIDRHYLASCEDLTMVDAIDVHQTTDGQRIVITRSFGASTAVQTIGLRHGSPVVDVTAEIDWHERQKLLKLTFPFAVKADRAASEVQFGHVFRPTHQNTSWQFAQFETPAHRWVHVGEPGFGVALANDATYGYDIHRHTLPSSASSTVVRASLLRAPLYPDPESDQGRHSFAFTIRPDATIADAVADGYALNVPLRAVTGSTAVAPLVTVSEPGIVVESVKLAEDGSGDVVVRLYEALGENGAAVLRTDERLGRPSVVDVLERPVDAAAGLVEQVDDRDGQAAATRIALRPFQLLTLRFPFVSAEWGTL
ncbi:alpha-mannosidase [Plantibacter sp. YIM 135347]|uniref:alpha-mannosidase n=1 Tax=Plantibacter sp. YIM 135347 TaxID=3423919 RepID=UPI003D32EB08